MSPGGATPYHRPVRWRVAAVAGLLVLAACGGSTDGGSFGPPAAGQPAGQPPGQEAASPSPPPSDVAAESTTASSAPEPSASTPEGSPTTRLYDPPPVAPVVVPPATTLPLPTYTLPTTIAPASCASADGFVTIAGHKVLLRAPALPARAALIIVLHGYTGSPEEVELTSGFTQLAARVGAIVAYPQGTKTRAGGYGWRSGAGVYETSTGDDVETIATVLSGLVAEHCADPARVLLVGESNGGGMAIKAACDPRINGHVTAVVPVIPAVGIRTLQGCDADGLRPVPLMVVAGQADDVVPFAGKPPLIGQEDWFRHVSTALNECSDAPLGRTDPSSEVTILTASACKVNTALVVVNDGTHRWPGGPSDNGQQQMGGFLATEAAWALFSANVAAGN
jgi:polyhydroxybutyrate depolymerase